MGDGIDTGTMLKTNARSVPALQKLGQKEKDNIEY